MSTDQLLGIPPISGIAGADLTGSRFCLVNVDDTTGKFVLPSAGGRCVGVLYNKPAADEAAEVHVIGVVQVLSGGAITPGPVKANSAGKVVDASAADVQAGSQVGIALEACDSGAKANVLLTTLGGGLVPASGEETLTNGGAASLNVEITKLAIDGTDPVTLADGLYVGQKKTFIVKSAANTPVSVLTPATVFAGQPATWTFNAVGQQLYLEWTATGWFVYDIQEAGADAPAAASTINPLVLNHDIAIDGTKDWIIPSGTVAGQIQKFAVSAAINTPVGTISGLFYDEDASADGVDINLNAAADMATCVWNGARWVTVELVSATVS